MPTSRWVLASRIACVLSLAFLVLVGVLVMMLSGESFWVLSDPAIPFIRFVQFIALLTLVGAIASVIAAGWSWSRGQERRRLSIGRTLVALSCLVCAYVAVAFHFLQVNLVY